MQQKTNLHQRFHSILKLSPQLKQHVFFLLSNVFYHSYDFFLSAFLNTKQKSQIVFTLFGLLDVHLIQIVLNLVFLALDFIIIVFIFIQKKKLYLIQIVDKIIFPFQVLILAICFHDSSSDFTYASKQWKIGLKIFFTLSTTVTLIIILTKNLWLNLRYRQNLQKGLNRLFRSQIIILMLKILTSFVLRTFIKSKTEIPNLIMLSAFNIALNTFYRTKIFYEHPNIEYLAFITQFYLWIPIVCGILQYFSYEFDSISIFFVVCTLFYLFLGILKPKVFLNFIESKYLSKIKQFQDIIRSYSKRENIRLNGKQEQVISYLSMSLTLYSNLHLYRLEFSQYFKTEVLKIAKQTTQILNSTVSFKRNLSEAIQNSQYNPCSTLFNPNPRSKTVKKGLKHQLYFRHQQNTYLSDKDLFNQICRSINQFLFDVEQCPSQVRLWICYNFADSSNKMVHHSFYSYFLNLNSQKNIFEEIDNSICYSYLIQKVGRQKSHRTLKNDQSYFQVCSNVVEKTQNFIRESFLDNQFCLFSEGAYFNSEFNAVVVQNSISSQIISQLNQFLKNQQLYIDLHTSFHEQKSRISNYFQNRNKLRLTLQEKIQAYSQLKKGQKKFYLQLIFNYIKDFWLKQDPLVAYENFVISLQNATKNRIHQNVNELCIEIDQRNRPKNITCVLSGINDFDTILMSCPEFKRLLQLQKDNFPNSLQSSNRQNDSANNYDENYHKVKLNTLMLPLWRQQHQKVISNNLFQRPIHHLDKKYFLLSKKQRSVLEVRLRMSFHMLYSKDLLIILDMSHEKIISIEIFDKENKTILFSHRKSEQTSKCSIYSESGTRNKLNSFIDTQIKQRIYEANKTYLNDKRQRILALQQITVFDQAYNIVIKKEQKHSTAIFQGVIDFKAKSMINFEQVCLEEQKHAFQRENKLKELKFYKQKQRFSIFGKKLHLFALAYLVSCLILIMIFQEYKVKQQKMLVQLINVLDDQVLLQDRYIKNDFSKTTGIGMFSNMYLKQLNVALLKTADRLNLFDHVTTSVKNLLIELKNRHVDSLDTIHKGIRGQKFYNPKWNNGANASFEINVFWSQLIYLQCLKNFAKIVQTRTISNTTNKVIRDTQIMVNLPKAAFSSFQLGKNMKFLQRVISNKKFMFNPQNGVFALGQKAQRELFSKIKTRQLQEIIIFEFLIGAILICMIVLLILLVKRIVDAYQITISTSDKFLMLFTKNREQLLRCAEELNRFSNQTIFGIVKPRKIDYKELKEKKFYTVTSINQQKAIQTKAVQKQRPKLPKSNLINSHRIYAPIHKQSNNEEQAKKFISLYFSYIIYPCVRYIMLVLILLLVFWRSSLNIASLQIYGKGFSSMTYANMQLINLFGTNLFLTNFRTYAQMFNNSYTISDLKKQFTEVIALVSNIDKMEIVNQLFLENNQNRQYIQSILYKNVCQQYSNFIECPSQMVPYMTGMYEKYGELIKNLNILNRHLINSPVSKLGTINTTSFQYLYIDSFQNLEQLLVISKGLKNISFTRLQQILSISPEGQYINGKENLLIYLVLSLYFLMDTYFLTRKLFNQGQILRMQFLRVGNFEMYSSEKFMMKGYHAFVNKAQEEQWAPINE